MTSLHGGLLARTHSFTDPDQYQSSIRGGDDRYSVLGRGAFEAELTTIRIGRLTLQHGLERLPRLASSGMPPNMVGLLGWFGDRPLPVVRGLQMRRGEWICLGPGMQSSHRTFGPNAIRDCHRDDPRSIRHRRIASRDRRAGGSAAATNGPVPAAWRGTQGKQTAWPKRGVDQDVRSGRRAVRHGYRDRNESRSLGTRAFCRGLQIAVRGVAIDYTAPIV
jgi:hypothetical protein